MSQTNFQRVFPLTQIIAIARQMNEEITDAETSEAEYIENLRDGSFALGTLLTHCKGSAKQADPSEVVKVKAMNDTELAKAVLAEVEDERKQQHLLRGMVSGLALSPTAFLMILELLLRYFGLHSNGLQSCIAATTEVGAPTEETQETKTPTANDNSVAGLVQ